MAPHEYRPWDWENVSDASDFGNMTVVENVMAGMHRRLKGGLFSYGSGCPGSEVERETLKEGKEILDSLGLLGKWESMASQLPYGKQSF